MADRRESGIGKAQESGHPFPVGAIHVDAPFPQMSFRGVPIDVRISAYIRSTSHTPSSWDPPFMTNPEASYDSVFASVYTTDYDKVTTHYGELPLEREIKGDVGHVDASYYAENRLGILHVPSLYGKYKQADALVEDPNMPALLQGAERFLLLRYPEIERFATPIEPKSWTEVINHASAFYLQQGYTTEDGTWYVLDVSSDEREATNATAPDAEKVTYPRPQEAIDQERKAARQGMVNQTGLLFAAL